MENLRSEILNLRSRYILAHRGLVSIQKSINQLNEEKDKLGKELSELREREKNLINNLEQELGREITADDLQKIIDTQ
jgi:chromosome segregation ATPase